MASEGVLRTCGQVRSQSLMARTVRRLNAWERDEGSVGKRSLLEL